MRKVTLLLAGALGGCAPGAATVPRERAPDPPVDRPTPTAPAPAPDPTATATVPEPLPDYAQPGPYAVASSAGTFPASCEMAYTTFAPIGHEPAALVVLAHGYLRSQVVMHGHAEQLASWGLAVVTPDLCALELFDLDFEDNANDLVALGEALGRGGPIVHAGHSFGALSSFLAATRDPAAIGHVGLDLVDEDGIGAAAAPALAVPAWGTMGELEWCNQYGTGREVYPLVPDARVIDVLGADHCDFEWPGNAGCALPCASGSGDDAVVTEVIAALTTAAALALSGEDPRGAELWIPGSPAHDAAVDAGLIADI